MKVTFTVTEGTKAHVTATRIEGVHAFRPGEVAKKLASKRKGFLRGGTVKDDKLAEDLARLKTLYRERGYRDVKVERLPFTPDPRSKGKGVVLAYKVDEG